MKKTLKQSLKRITSLLLTSLLMVGLMSGGVWAKETKAIGGENSASASGAEKIQAMAVEGDYEYADVAGGAEITSYLGAAENVVVPATLGGKPVVKIGDWAFSGSNHPNCVAIKTITLPAGITIIDDYAFAWCTNLTSINIPTGVTSINGYAFYKCTSLTSVIIPEGVENIWGNVFDECPNITSMVIPKSVANIGILAFNKCVGLTTIQFNSATTVITDTYNPIMPNTTKIIGYDPSTAKDYALKHGNPFQSLGQSASLQSIAITTPASKLSYQIGETLDISGLVVTGTYSDGTTKIETVTAANITGFNSAAVAANQVLIITINEQTVTYMVQIEAAGEPGIGEFVGFLGQDPAGNFYLYNQTGLNNAYIAYYLNPGASAAKMYQHFLNNQCEIVALKDRTKGYMDYKATATANLMARIRGEAFDINAYFGSSDVKLYEGVVSNVGIVDKDGNVTH